MRRVVVMFLIASLGASCGSVARAHLVEFTNIIDSTSGNFASLTGFVAVNDAGVVAFRASTASGQGVFRYDPNASTFTPIMTLSGTPYESLDSIVSINNGGTVTLLASDSSGPDAILKGSGGGTTIVAQTSSQFSSLQSAAVINDNDTVVFRAYLDTPGTVSDRGQGIYQRTGNGSIVTVHELPMASQSFSLFAVPSINRSGVVTFGGLDTSFPTGFGLLKAESGTVTPLLSYESGGHGAVDINDHGDIVFSANPTGSAPDGLQVLYQGTSTPVTVIGLVGGISSFGLPDINNQGLVAFGGIVSGGTVIYLGNQRVIGPGDALFGSTVTGVSFTRGGLNNNGQLAFGYTLQNGVSGVAFANSSVPEPNATTLAFVAALLGLGCRQALRRSHRGVHEAGC